MKSKPNPFNPEGLRPGDTVRLLSSGRQMRVITVTGTHSNKIFCREVGHELFASCFALVHRDAGKPDGRTRQ